MIAAAFLYSVLCFIFGVVIGDMHATKGERE